MADNASPFLTAEWRHLVMLNYEVDPNVLTSYLPRGTELDLFQEQCLISLVGFQFRETSLRGWRIPWHVNFDEVNLRFYVRRVVNGQVRRGVVFLREIVGRHAISWVANRIYHENYVTHPIFSRIIASAALPDATGLTVPRQQIRYHWRARGQEFQFGCDSAGEPTPLVPGSISEFITEHYWGYVRRRDGSTGEYEVRHPAWRVWQPVQVFASPQIAAYYGGPFEAALSQPAHSALLAEGSAVSVHPGRIIERQEAAFCRSGSWPAFQILTQEVRSNTSPCQLSVPVALMTADC